MYQRFRFACAAALLLIHACSGDARPSGRRAPLPRVASEALGANVSGSSIDAAPSTVYDLTSLGSADWAHWGAQGFVHKSGGNQISDLTPLGGTCGTNARASRHAAWSGGAPTASANDDQSYYWCNGSTGQGFSFTVPASTTTRTLTVYWGGAPYDGTHVKLVAHLGDGSAPDYVVTKTNTASINTYLTTISYAADSNTTLTLSLTKDDDSTGLSVDVKAAWLSLASSAPNTTLTFEDLSDGASLSSYGGVDWTGGGVGWKVWEGGSTYTLNAYIDSTATNEVATRFTLPPGQVLKSLKIATGTGTPATVALSSPGNPERVFTDIGGVYQLKNLGWTVPADTVIVKVTCAGEWGASDIAFDDLVYGPPSPGDTLVTFEALNDGESLALHAGIDWTSSGTGWKIWDGGPELTRNAYVDSTATSEVTATFRLPAGRVLKSLKLAGSGAAATVKLSSPGNPERVFTSIGTAYQVRSLGWTTASSVVTVKVTGTGPWGASDLAFDDLIYGPVNLVDTMVTFEDLSDGAALSSYGGIDWTGQHPGWKVWDGGPSVTRNAYVDSTATSEVVATFTLPAGQVLKSLKISGSGAAATLTLSSPGNPERIYTDINSTPQVKTLAWTTASSTVTVKITGTGQWGASDLAFDDIVYGSASGTGSLLGSSENASSTVPYDLARLGTDDWAHWGAQGFVHKAGADQLSDLTPLGGTCDTNVQATRHAAWIGGTPTASASDDRSYRWCNGVTGQGFAFTAPASSEKRTLSVYWGGAPYDGTRVKLVARLGDGSAPDYVVTKTNTAAVNMYVTTIEYSSRSATRLTVSLTRDDDASGLSVDIKAAWLSTEEAPLPPDPSDGVVWEPIPLDEMRAQRDAFRWDQTTALSEVPSRSYTLNGEQIDLPPIHYAQIYVRNVDELRELEEMGIHYDRAPLFDSEWPETTSSLTLPNEGDREDGGGQFVFALLPAQIYNAIRAEALAGEDTYRALILRPLPAEALAGDGTVDWDFLFENLGSWAPAATELTDEGEIVPPLEEEEEIAGDQKRIGRRLRKWTRSIINGVRTVLVDGMRRVIAWEANLVTRETVLRIKTSLNDRTRAPMVRAWDDGAGGYGQPLTLKGLRVNVTGMSRLTLYKGKLNADGETSIAVPRTLRVNICFEADSPTAKVEWGVFWPVLHCWPKHRPRGSSDDIARPVGDTEFYALAQLIDARDYADKVLGFKPPKAMVQAGWIAQALTLGGAGNAIVPCLAAPKATVSLVNTYVTGLNIVGLGIPLEFLFTTDIILSKKVRSSRVTPVHEYGHFFFCNLLADTRRMTYDVVWSQVVALRNLSSDSTGAVKALNEGFADWFASQVVGSVNYFAPPGSVGERDGGKGKDFIDYSAPARGEGLEANIGGPGCPLPGGAARTGCFDQPKSWEASDRTIGSVATILHDAIDGNDCGVNDVCRAQLRNDAAMWDLGPATFALERPFRLEHVGDEQITLTPRDITQSIRAFADRNGVVGTALGYDAFYHALASKMLERGHTYDQICKLFALHRTDGDCPSAWIEPPSAGPELLRVEFRAQPAGTGSVAGIDQGATVCGASSCQVQRGGNATLTAVPGAGFRFKAWSGCSSSSDPTLWLTNVIDDKQCVANFESSTPQVSVAFSATSGGEITASGAPSGACGASSCTFPIGGSVTLTAAARPGYNFGGWSGCSSQTASVLTLSSVQSNQSCRATFVAIPTFTVRANASEGGRVRPAITTVVSGGSVPLVATADPGYRFVNFTGDSRCMGTNHAPVVGSVTSDVTCTAHFTRVFSVRANANNAAAGTVSVSPSSVDSGGSATVRATANARYRFDHYSGSPQCTGTNPVLTIAPVTSDVTCVAHFVQTAFTVTALANSGGSVNFGSTTVNAGGSVTIIATPNAGFSFAGYTGSPQCVGTNPRLVIAPVNSDISCVASFGAIPKVTVTFGPNITGAGTIAASGAPAGTCGASSCTFNSGSSVTLTAQPNTGYAFVSWAGCAFQASPVLSLNVVTSNSTCHAIFARIWPVTFTAEWPAVPTASVPGGAACTAGGCGVPNGGTVNFSATTSQPGFFIYNWRCTETTTGRVVESPYNISQISLTNVTKPWSCRVFTGQFVQ